MRHGLARTVCRGLVVLLGLITFLHMCAHAAEADHAHPSAVHRADLVSPVGAGQHDDGPPSPPGHDDHQMHSVVFEIPVMPTQVSAERYLIAIVPPPLLEGLSPSYSSGARYGRAPPYGHRARAKQTNTLAVWRC